MSKVPDGWVRMSEYDDRPDKKHGNPGEDYRRLLFAAKKKEIDVLTIAGVRGMLVNKEQADAHVAKARGLTKKMPQAQADVIASLARIEGAVAELSRQIGQFLS